MRSRTTELRQKNFRSSCFTEGDVSDRISEQWTLTYAFDSARQSGEPERLSTEAEHIDLDLARSALSHLQQALRDATIHDAATLLRELVLDTSVEQPSRERWVDWLSQAECWPRLAMQHWVAVQWEAEDKVVAALEAEGVVLSEQAKNDLYLAIRGITLADLIPAEAYERIFPGELGEEERHDKDF